MLTAQKFRGNGWIQAPEEVEESQVKGLAMRARNHILIRLKERTYKKVCTFGEKTGT